MRKSLFILTALLLAVFIAMPAFAAVEFKYGGQFRWRLTSESNVFDGTSDPNFFAPVGQHHNADDNRNFIDQRLRLYFSFIASPNLKVVVKWEMGDTGWGNVGTGYGVTAGGGITKIGAGPNSGGDVGADTVNIELKNAYVEFNIPECPTTAIIGIQTLTLLDSWIIDDDFSAATFVTKLDPFRISIGYIAGQNGAEGGLFGSIASQQAPAVLGNFKPSQNWLPYTNDALNIDTLWLSVDYICAPWKASFVFLWQDAHDTVMSAVPNVMSTPFRNYVNVSSPFFFALTDAGGFAPMPFTTPFGFVQSNQLFDFGLNVQYKIDWLSAYISFVKNFGHVDFQVPFAFPGAPPAVNVAAFNHVAGKDSLAYTGWMIDAGVTYYCAPFTLNLGGFYTSGPDAFSDRNAHTNIGNTATDITWFVYPASTSKYFSEIIGGGVLADDLYAYRGFTSVASAAGIGQAAGLNGMYWMGYGFPTNLWTITIGGSWQCDPKTKISASYWYFGTSTPVPVSITPGLVAADNRFDMASNIGHELDLYLDYNIVDNLILTIVGAYLISGDAFAPVPSDITAASAGTIIAPGANARFINNNFADNAYKVGARLQWNF